LACYVGAHAVDAAALAEVIWHFLFADAAVLLQRVGRQLLLALGIAVGHVQRPHIRRENGAIDALSTSVRSRVSVPSGSMR
jgi:hypothetical protein